MRVNIKTKKLMLRRTLSSTVCSPMLKAVYEEGVEVSKTVTLVRHAISTSSKAAAGGDSSAVVARMQTRARSRFDSGFAQVWKAGL